jgi:CRISPR-associated endonuclease/helicase Cas3
VGRSDQQSAWFESAFRGLDASNRPPLKWQARLYGSLAEGRCPAVCRLPTGLGKTSVIPLWLIALAAGAKLPRRLVYVVNRRTVVDQATDDAVRILRRLTAPSEAGPFAATVEELARRLDGLAGEHVGPPVAVSALRGELADNGEWKVNPARAAIIVGTIDMIGSKLLFSGYGDGRYGRAHHAGLIGQDVLLVHDEAHLSPAFDAVLNAVETEQKRCGDRLPLKVMRLSATIRPDAVKGAEGGQAGVFGVEAEDRDDPVVAERLKATKTLGLVTASKGGEVAEIAAQALALGRTPARVLVYVRSPKAAAAVADAVCAKLGAAGAERVAMLTGTLRGKERDELAAGPVFRAFRSGADRGAALAASLYLVSTSAGEVGADLDADHLVCDLTTLDSMAQRFGRVNRLGGKDHQGQVRQASVVVVTAGDDEGGGKKAPTPYTLAVGKTGAILGKVAAAGGDVSPAGMDAVMNRLTAEEKRAAFTPPPTILATTDVLFDAWAMTSIAGELPGRPPVEPYLHGVTEEDPPETTVAWRADVEWLARAGGVDEEGGHLPCGSEDLEAVFEVFGLRAAERLKDRTDRVQTQLGELADRLEKSAAKAAGAAADAAHEPDGAGAAMAANPLVVLMRQGLAEWVRLRDLAPADKNIARRVQARLAYATVVLPAGVGGLSERGTLDGQAAAPAGGSALDVAEWTAAGVGDRYRVLVKGDGSEHMLGGTMARPVEACQTRHVVQIGGDEDGGGGLRLEYRVRVGEEREVGERVGLAEHQEAVGVSAERMGRALGLDAGMVAALGVAGRLHDQGKARVVWQRYAMNHPQWRGPAGPIAKSDRYLHSRALAGYRHELGSLLDAEADAAVAGLDVEQREVVLHVIAAHHGWARPHFEPRHFDVGEPGKPVATVKNERAAIEAVRRFATLQARYGRWGLAWLEAVLRCADAEASRAGVVRGGGHA